MEELLIENLQKSLREGQKIIGDWKGGKMAISAVPGAGKSHCLAIGAVLAIAKFNLNPKKQLLIVTYTRSAAISIKTKINNILKENLQGILGPQAHSSFVVYTLHGLALNLASRYQELAGIDLENSRVIVPSPSHKIIRNTVENWIINNEFIFQKLVEGEKKYDEETEKIRRQMVLRTEILPSLAFTMIKEAKSSGLTPKIIFNLSKSIQDKINILEIAAGLYKEYELLLEKNNFIDYETMILAGLTVLQNQEILKLFQEQFFGIFEDEAQDSSPLQGKLINLLAANYNNSNNQINLVRVGDPNQAINSTFTPADPTYFNQFCHQCKEINSLSTMDEAGRSNTIIIRVANYLIKWFNKKNKDGFRYQLIKPVADNDPQINANPKSEGQGLEICYPSAIYETVELIGNRVKQLLKNNPDRSAAILVKQNKQGEFLAEKLAYLEKEEGIKIYEVGEIDRQTKIPEEMLILLKFMARPHSPERLKMALELLENKQLIKLKNIDSLVIEGENFLYPLPPEFPFQDNEKKAALLCQKLLKAKLDLPPGDLIAFLGIILGYEGGELATMQKLSERINKEIIENISLQNIINILEEIVISQKFDVVEEENENNYIKPNQLTIITMHKSKGLDWDYVFIPFLYEKNFPQECYWSPNKHFLGDFNLEEVARIQLRKYVYSQELENINNINNYLIPNINSAWNEAKILKEKEEYRLLYVAITRAKRLLWMSSETHAPSFWSTFNWENNEPLNEQKPCTFLSYLNEKWTQVQQQI